MSFAWTILKGENLAKVWFLKEGGQMVEGNWLPWTPL